MNPAELDLTELERDCLDILREVRVSTSAALWKRHGLRGPRVTSSGGTPGVTAVLKSLRDKGLITLEMTKARQVAGRWRSGGRYVARPVEEPT